MNKQPLKKNLVFALSKNKIHKSLRVKNFFFNTSQNIDKGNIIFTLDISYFIFSDITKLGPYTSSLERQRNLVNSMTFTLYRPNHFIINELCIKLNLKRQGFLRVY